MSTEAEQIKLAQDDADQAMKFARSLLSRTAIAIKLATMHDLDNAAMVPPITGLLEAILWGGREYGQMRLQAVGENFFLNQEIIKLDFTSYEAAQTLRGLLARVGAQEISFLGNPQEAGLRQFLLAYQQHSRSQTPTQLLRVRFPQIALREVTKAEEAALAPAVEARRQLVNTYAQLGLMLEAQIDLMKAKKQARIAKVRRAIHSVADASEGHESLLMALTRYDAFAGKVPFHLAATTALTMLMCRRLKMTRTELAEACMAAAFHDVALDELPPPKDATVTPEELDMLKRVPLRTMLRLTDGALMGDALERLVVAYEHVARKPQIGNAGFGHLIAIPCVFDRLTRPGAPRSGLMPDQALRVIVNQSGSRFDPRLVQLFASIMGLYPVGTTVKLNSGELALVIEVPATPAAFARPRVKVFRNAQGGAVDYALDLAQPGEKRAIVQSVDPAEVQLNVPQFLLA